MLGNSIILHNKRAKGYRAGDILYNRLHILSHLEYTDELIGQPIIRPIQVNDSIDSLLPFSKAVCSHLHSATVHFFESDRAFARVLHNPNRYVDILKRFKYVISPDFSQKLDMPPFICYQNAWWNKALGAFWQHSGINVIPNVAWSRPDSYDYAFSGMPKHSAIAINCSAIKGNPVSRYFWMKGYERALTQLEPTLIIRYGDRMPGEDVSRSIYFENENLKRLRNGR